jgi:hypothetical protein
MQMKIITDLSEQIEYITEARESGEKNHYIQGPFMQAERPNRNGRIYPIDVLQNAVNVYIEKKVNMNCAYGEFEHPETGPRINLERVSHMVTELKFDGSDVIGKAKLTETPMGKIAIGLLKSGANLGVSSRGMGSLVPSKDGIMIVQPDFQLATAADIVADPSAPNAYVRGIMENVDWIYEASTDSWYQEMLHDTRKRLKRMKMDDIERTQLGIFESFIDRLSHKK